MRLPRLATVLGGLLLSRRARGFAGRHAGKLALATLAFELWQRRQGPHAAPHSSPEATPQAKHHARNRWSGRPRR